MDARATGGFLRFFDELPDPRAANHVHRLSGLFAIAIVAVICGADSWVDVAMFAQSKRAWLGTFLDLERGVPSHDTFGRVFARIDPDAFERCFRNWMASLKAAGCGGSQGSGGSRLIAIDGKSIRRSFEHAWDKSGMVHLVSAFADANRMVFAQVAVQDKGNEIGAIRHLLGVLDLGEGDVITIDAIGCQKEIAEQVAIDRDADYVLAVKDNQPTLHKAVKHLLDEAILENFAGLRHDFVESVDGDHGRIETRRLWMTDELGHLPEAISSQWPALASVAVVESTRESSDGKRSSSSSSSSSSSIERRYFISSMDRLDAAAMAGHVRGHWGIENRLHWQLDVSFGEDQRRVRKDHGAENFSRLCRMALNLLKSDKSLKVGVKAKRLRAGWDEPYLLWLMTG
jgi:predicted transposase YbfD/YdcC